MPKKVLDLHKAGKNIQQKAVLINEFGQTRQGLQLNDGGDGRMDSIIRNTVKR